MNTTTEMDKDSLEIPATDVSPASGTGPARSVFATASAQSSGDRVRPVFPESNSIETRLPSTVRRQRPSPALDPVRRASVSRLAKWGVLLSLLMFVAYLPVFFYNAGVAAAALGGDVDKGPFFLAAVTAAATFAAVLATGIPRLIVPGLFGRWREPVEALRDWTIVGITSGVLYYVAVLVARSTNFGPANGVQTLNDWMMYRFPLLAVAGTIGVFVARSVAIRGESLIARGVGPAIVQIVVQVLLLGALEHFIELGVRAYAPAAGIGTILGGGAALFAILSVGTIAWAMSADANLSSVRKRPGGSGFDDGTAPVDLTLTVIGGRESGKTVLMAGAFYEWSTQNFGDLRITPATDKNIDTFGLSNLEEVARELYVDSHFPVGTVSTQNLPFDLSLGQDKIARFSFLDYPGGAIAGKVADKAIVQDFWNRVEDTDGIVMIADMSYVRRAHRDSDFMDIRNAYRTVMQRLVDRNGRRRVVPVALVLTKCDEFIDPESGRIDMAALKAGLHEFQYDELENEWREMNERNGPGFAEFTTWITSAITYSQPQLGPDGEPDYSKPFAIAPAPPSITPTGCASPLLWMTSKVMRWNVTLFYDISAFLFGSSPRMRRRVDSIIKLEQLAEERAGRA